MIEEIRAGGPTLTTEMERILGMGRPPKSLSLEDMRTHAVEDKARWNEGAADGLDVADGLLPDGAGGRPFRTVAPQEASGPPIVAIHGGGWTVCDLETHMSIFAGLARATGRTVIAPHARRTPEAPYPAALEDTMGALSHFSALHPGGFDLAGDSAGANLALAALLKLRDTGRIPKVRAVVAFYGCYRRRFDTPSHRSCGDGRFGLSSEKMHRYWELYCGDHPDPSYADLSDQGWHGLPPVQIHAAEADPLFDDSVWLRDRIRSDGGDCDFEYWRGVTHGFLHYAAELTPARDAFAIAARFLGNIR